MKTNFKSILLTLLLTISFPLLAEVNPSGIIITPLHELLSYIISNLSSVGGSIIVLTIIIRIGLSPLQYLSAKSMKKMEKINPQMEILREKFKNNKQKLGEETVKLYKENSVNPLMGIIPMIVQMPLFIAMFELLKKSPFVKGQEFGGWILDLSLSDPIFVLPIIAGVLQVAYSLYVSKDQSNNNVLGEKLKYAMPIVFSCFMFMMPSAVLLYSISSTTLLIAEKIFLSKLIS